MDWLFAGLDGQFRVVSETAERVVRLRWGTDVASIRTACGSGWQVLASSSDEGTSDTIRAYEFPDRDPVPVSAAVENSGARLGSMDRGEGRHCRGGVEE